MYRKIEQVLVLYCVAKCANPLNIWTLRFPSFWIDLWRCWWASESSNGFGKPIRLHQECCLLKIKWNFVPKKLKFRSNSISKTLWNERRWKNKILLEEIRWISKKEKENIANYCEKWFNQKTCLLKCCRTF
jgi:hypothetical protein